MARGIERAVAFVLAASVAVAAGCEIASAPGYLGRDIQPTSKTAIRHQYRGFSVEPPKSDGWYVRISEQTHLAAIYRRTLPGATHTFFAGVALVQLDTSLPVEEALAVQGTAKPERVQMIEDVHEVDSLRKTPCIRYRRRYLDSKSVQLPGTALEIDERGFVCAHPTMPGMAIRAFFSERGLRSEIDPSLWIELDEFLRSVHIESAPGVQVAWFLEDTGR